MIPIRNARHSYLRSLCTEWLRKHKPVIYRLLTKRAYDKHPDKVKGNGNG